MVDTPTKEKQKIYDARKREDARRQKDYQYWMRRDAKYAKKLKAMWDERDRERVGKLFDYICTMCNRPFATPRKLPHNNAKRCYYCTRFVRQQTMRNYRATHPEKVRQYEETRKRNKVRKEQQAKDIVFQQMQELKRQEPQVVWHA